MLTLVLLATAGAWLGFANPIFQFPLAALAFPLGIIWIGLRATSLKNSFKFGWLAGTLAAVGCMYWMVIPVQIYGGLPWYIATPCPILAAAALGIYYGLFAMAMHYAGQRTQGILFCLLAGLTWTTMEMLQDILLSGFPWMNLASAFAPWPFAIQGASVIGAYGLSGLFVTLSAALLLYSTYRSALWLAVITSLVIVGFGSYRISSFTSPAADFPVTVVQGNVDQSMKWVPKLQADTVRKYSKLSLEAIFKDKPRVVVWPETALPFYLQDESPFRKAVQVLAKDSKTSIITGSPAYRMLNLQTRKYILFNRAWLVEDDGRIYQSYDKEHLVPFGEYMPFEEWIPFEKLVQAAGDFIPGTDNKPLRVDGIALGMLICYEAIFPDLAQKQVERGANALVNISNDAWFGETSAPLQHLNLTTMRAVEQGRWLIRSTNTGISSFIDPLGMQAVVGNQFVAESITAKIAPITDTTIYHQLYSYLNTIIYVLTALGFAWVTITSRKN